MMKLIVIGEKNELTDMAPKILCMNHAAHITLKGSERKSGECSSPKIPTKEAAYKLMSDSDRRRTAAILMDNSATHAEMPDEFYPPYLAGVYEAYFRCLRMGILSDKQLSIILSKGESDIASLSRIWEDSGPGGQTEKCRRLLQREREKEGVNP